MEVQVRGGRLLELVAQGQGIYFVLTGVWPLIDIHSFELVTGPKVDDWLVKTVGVLVTIIGCVLLVAGRRSAVTREIALLGAGSALGLAAIDVVYVAADLIPPIYLLDTLAELVIVTLWAAGRRSAA